jgi:hypothetical protein
MFAGLDFRLFQPDDALWFIADAFKRKEVRMCRYL